MTIRPFRKWGRALVLGGGALALGFAGLGGVLATQVPEAGSKQVAPAEAAPVQRNYLNKNVIQLPIQIAENSRSLISEVHLYVKDQPNAPWTLKDKVGPTAKAFTYQAARDGEYWFTMVTVDKQGRGYPSDVANEPPGLIVVIDTTPPQLELTNLGQTPEGQLIQCEVRDGNLDTARTKFQFQGGDRVFRVLEPVVGRPSVFCIPTQAVCTGVVRATAEDLAGNQTLREVNIGQMATVAKQAPPQEAIKPAPLPLPDLKPAPLPDLKVDARPLPLPDIKPLPLPTNINPTPTNEPMPNARPSVGTDRPDWKDGPRLDRTVEPANATKAPAQTTSNLAPAAHSVPAENLKRQFVNSTKVFLDYQIENAGQSGVGKVEVWITSDRTKSWQKLREETQSKSPVEVVFPSDGLYGVTLIASNGRGVAGAAPAAGDAPDWWIEVDTTCPAAQITKTTTATENGKSVVHIHWSVQDKNCGDAPVDLFYAATPRGPWLLIAKGLKGEGHHRWAPPIEIGAQAHLQLVARDTVGNTTTVISQEPIVFDDPIRPRAVIRGISTGAVSPMTPATPVQIVQPVTR